MNTSFLKEVAHFIGSSKIEKELQFLEGKKEDCPLVLPLMGEFSSGKTTLINALTDSKQLETATMPTTATIYEVHFGCEKCCAEVYYSNQPKEEIDNISDLRNEKLVDAAVVEVYDTSNIVSPSIVLVDTPGLSSPDRRHQQTLVDFLPQADGILLVSDINQPGLTKTLADFIKTMELSKRRIYLILTKCDTKSETEIKEAKKYIEHNNGIKECNIVAVSAKENNLSELLDLLQRIQNDKAEILEQVNRQRIVNIAQELMSSITTLKRATNSDEELDDAIEEQEQKLGKLNSSIQKIVDSLTDDITEVSRKAEKTFEDTVSNRLEILTGSKSANYDAEAISIINNSASLIISNMCAEIQNIVLAKAAKSTNEVEFSSLDKVDLSSFSADGLTYNLNLNTIGHEHDGKIATGLKIAAAIAAVCICAPAAGAAEAGTAAAEAGTAGSIFANYGKADLAVDVVQTAAIVKEKKQREETIKKYEEQKELIRQKYGEYNRQDQLLGQQMGASKGVVESMVGLVTDSTVAKPQRRRAIHQYMDSTLMPNFKALIKRNYDRLLASIHNGLLNDSTLFITELKESLNRLKEERRTKENDFRAKIQKLNDYCITLNNEYLCGNF